MPASAELSELYAQAAAATAVGSQSFFFATRFFPRELARSAHAVYWFCRYTDDLVDECPTVSQGRTDLDAWERDVYRALESGTAEHPVLALFCDAVARHAIPHDLPLELIAGMRMDLDGQRYATFDELRVFCYRVASVVGLMMSHVIGFVNQDQQSRGLAHAIDLGIAMQLTNILRDVGEDLERGRVYLPAEEMERFGYSEQDLRAHVRNDAFRALLAFQMQRAREYYQRAEPGIALLRPEGRFAVKIAADVYRDILSRIAASDGNVFTRRAVVPTSRKLMLTARSMALPVARHTLRSAAFWRR